MDASEAIKLLSSDTANGRLSAIRSIYTRGVFSRAEVKECISVLRDGVDFASLGAIYYVLEMYGRSIYGYLGCFSKDFILLYDFERWNDPIWNGTDFVMWEVARSRKLTKATKAKQIVPEFECLQDLRLLENVLFGYDACSEICRECTIAFLQRTSFDVEEMQFAMRKLSGSFPNTEFYFCCVHVISASLAHEGVAVWLDQSRSDPRFASAFECLLKERNALVTSGSK